MGWFVAFKGCLLRFLEAESTSIYQPPAHKSNRPPGPKNFLNFLLRRDRIGLESEAQEILMELLNPDVREATQAKLAEAMEGPVTLVLYTQEPGHLVLPDALQGQECQFCKENRQLLEEVAALSDKLRLEVHDYRTETDNARALGIDKIPALALLGPESLDHGIRFYGIPSGYEYTGLIEAIVDVSRGRTGLSEKTRGKLRSLDRDVHLQVFVTPTCPYCTFAVRLSHQFALESPRVRADMVEATEFPHLANKNQVMGVPRTVVNDSGFIEGAMPEDKFLEEILKAAAPASPGGESP
jgi:glutaredoxin-like protein